jgi:F0F1-type ATP synthase assembly protein I
MSTPPSGAPGSEGRPEENSVESSEERKERERQVNLRESNSAWMAVAYLITGPLIYGGLGALLDHWLGTTWLVGAGIVGGMALSLYLIWFRYGTH